MGLRYITQVITHSYKNTYDKIKGKERKSIYTAHFHAKVHTKRSGMHHTVSISLHKQAEAKLAIIKACHEYCERSHVSNTTSAVCL